MGQVTEVEGSATLDAELSFGVVRAAMGWTDSVADTTLGPTPVSGCAILATFNELGTPPAHADGGADPLIGRRLDHRLVPGRREQRRRSTWFQQPIGTVDHPANLFQQGPATPFQATIDNEVFAPCVGAATTNCSSVQWTASACGDPPVSFTGPVSNVTGPFAELQADSCFNPFSITSFECENEVVTLCGDRSERSTPICATTVLALTWAPR